MYAHSDRSTITTLPATAAISVYFRENALFVTCKQSQRWKVGRARSDAFTS